jgi:esterase
VTPPRAVVVLHGFLGSRRNVATLAHRIAQQLPSLPVVALDLAGHGHGRPLPGDARLASLARVALEDARAFRLPEPLALIGHSLGGRVALRACEIAPTAIAHATLLDIGPSPIKDDATSARIVDALLTAPESAPGRDAFRAHFRRAGLPDDVTEWLLLNLAREDTVYRWVVDRTALAALRRRTSAEDLWAVVEGPRTCSLACVRGELSEYVSDGDARRLVAAGCPVETIRGAGHFLHVERPAEVVEQIVRTLR